MNIIDVVTSAHSGSSGKGTSYWTEVSTCSRASKLRRKHGDTLRLVKPNPKANIGVMFHAIAEQYHLGKLTHDDIAWGMQSNLDADTLEAIRIALAYTQRYAPDHFGKVLATEKLIPSNELETMAIARMLGLDKPYTARIDLVTYLDEERLAYLEQAHCLLLNGPGIYLVDHKTHGAIDSQAQTHAELSVQFLAYPLIWNATQPEPCRGIIENNVVRHAKLAGKSFYLAFRATQQDDLMMLQRWVQWAHAQEEADIPNLAACRGKFGPCEFYTVGLCDRK